MLGSCTEGITPIDCSVKASSSCAALDQQYHVVAMEENNQDNVLRFEASAYLQRLIGRELISTEYVAVAELVKNAYDAGARNVVIELRRTPEQRIVISDDGVGMSLEEFRRLWMMPGYSEKLQTDVSGVRPLLGEKGIGRFAADKLARRLTVVTKKVLDKEALVVEFDWDEFGDRATKMRDIPIPFSHRPDSELEEHRCGTRLELSELRQEWDRRSWQKLRGELHSLVSPFKAVRGFRILAKAEGWPSGEIKSVFEAQRGYQYAFSLTKGGYLRWKLSRPARVLKSLDKPAEETKRKKYGTTSFGPIRGEFYYVDRPGSLKKQGFEPGIGVYRDGFRVEPYGRAGDDWLQVKSWKAKRHGHAPITPSRLFGFVEITGADNSELRDVTNREGLLDGPHFQEFHNFVMRRFRQFADIVQQEKEDLEDKSPAIEAQQEELKRESRSEALAQMASLLAHQLRQPLNNIRGASSNLAHWLERSGHSDEQVQQLTQRIERNVLRMDDNITALSRLADGLKDKAVEFDLGARVRQVAQMRVADFIHHGVQLELHGCEDGNRVVFSEVALEFILDNYLTNALNAVLDAEPDLPKLVVRVERVPTKSHRVVVEDNGKGVPPELAGKLFEEAVLSGHGQGQGLLWCRVWAEEYGGEVGYEAVQPSGAAFFVRFDRRR